MEGDRSAPRVLRNRARRLIELIDDDGLPPELRIALLNTLVAFVNRSPEEIDLGRLFPPRRGALPVPDDTRWAPPRRRARR